MKYLFFSIALFFIGCAVKSKTLDTRDGWYFGQNEGFLPKRMVFAQKVANKMTVTCFLPLKGQYFLALEDELIAQNGSDAFIGQKSQLVVKNHQYFFSILPLPNSKVKLETTKIIFKPECINELEKIKLVAKPY